MSPPLYQGQHISLNNMFSGVCILSQGLVVRKSDVVTSVLGIKRRPLTYFRETTAVT